MEAYGPDCRETAYTSFPVIRDRRVLLVVGRIDPVKNQDWLVQRMPEIRRYCPGALLVLAGSTTDPAYERQIRNHIEQLGLAGDVLLTGGLPPRAPSLIGLLQIAAVLVCPSLSETFGLVLLEAWSAGAPVIASNTSGARQLIENGTNGYLFDLESPETFHDALRSTLGDPAFAARMAANGRGLVRNGFDNIAVTAKVKDLYLDLVERKRT